MKSALEFYRKVDDIIEKITEIFCGILLLSIIFICFFNTCGRYLFRVTFVWADEIVRYMSVWLTIVGASLTARADEHTTLDILQEFTRNPKLRAALYALTRILSVVIILLLLPCGFEMVGVYGGARSSATHLPGWVLYCSYPFGMIAIVIAYLRTAPVKFIQILKGE